MIHYYNNPFGEKIPKSFVDKIIQRISIDDLNEIKENNYEFHSLYYNSVGILTLTNFDGIWRHPISFLNKI